MSTCRVDTCDLPIRQRGLCNYHRQVAARRAEIKALMLPPIAKSYEFIRLHSTADTDACIWWPYAQQSNGYGYTYIDGQRITAHRAMCLLAHGPAPSDSHAVAHGCGERMCVNPRHLRWATPVENDSDKDLHGTRLYGERVPTARLCGDDVVRIRETYAAGGRTQQELADLYGVGLTTVCRITRGDAWARTPGPRRRREARGVR